MPKIKLRNGGPAPRKLSFLSMSNFSFNCLQNGNDSNKSATDEEEINEDKPKISEQKFALSLFVITAVILCGKLYFALKPHLAWRELIHTEWINESGKKMMSYRWESGVFGENLLVPLLCGISITIFTWLIVYLDSDVPGVNPPTPFSPSRESFYDRRQKTFHLGYLMSLASGLIVFSLLFITNYY